MANVCISAPHLQHGRYPQVTCLSYVPVKGNQLYI